MNKAKFWNIIQEAVDKAPGTTTKVARDRETILVNLLQYESAENINIFDKIWRAYEGELATEEHYDAACKVNGWMSDDSWRDARQWMIVQGKEVVEAMIADPLEIIRYTKKKQDLTAEIYVVQGALDKKIGEWKWELAKGDPARHLIYDLKNDCLTTYEPPKASEKELVDRIVEAARSSNPRKAVKAILAEYKIYPK